MEEGGIELRLYASLQKWQPLPVTALPLTGIRTVGDLVRKHGIPEVEIAIVMVNERRAHLGSALRAGDRVSLFPLIGGG